MKFILVLVLLFAASRGVSCDFVSYNPHTWRTTFHLPNESTTITGCRLNANSTLNPFPLCHNYISPTNCSCSDNCWITRNCCLNFQHGHRLLQTSIKDMYSCNPIQNKILLTNSFTSYALVSRCPNSFPRNDLQRAFCETADSHGDRYRTIPVTDILSNVSYRNVYCAHCHSVHEYLFWDTTILCRRNIKSAEVAFDALLTGDPQGKCRLITTPLNQRVPSICPPTVPINTIDTCPSTWEHPNKEVSTVVPWLCQTVVAPFKDLSTEKAYKNEYCLACNNGRLSEYAQCLPMLHPKQRGMKPPMVFNSFSLLVDFRGKGNYVGIDAKCSDGLVHDIFKNTCRAIICKPGLYLGPSGVCETPELSPSKKSLLDIQDVTTTSRLDVAHCSQAMVSLSEYDSYEVLDNGTLLLQDKNHHITYGPNEYQSLTNATVLLCFKSLDNYAVKFPIALESLTIIGSCLSILALCIKIALYIALPWSRNMPMTIVLCLSVCLLTGQLLFLAAGVQILLDAHGPCFIVAIIIHYSFLAAFTWMNVLSYDLWRTFSNTSSNGNSSPFCQGFRLSNRFRKYSVYAWVLPGVIVACAITMDIVLDSPIPTQVKPSYGTVYCMISSRTGLLVFFVAPMGLLLLTNVVFFVGTAFNIRETTKLARIASVNKSQGTGSEDGCRFLLYTKLASIMGVTWISAFVAAYSDVQALWYVFVAFNSIQGVYVLVAFTPHRRVWRQLRKRFSGSDRGPWIQLRHRSLGQQRSISSTSSTSTRVTYLGARTSVPS